MTLLKKEDPFFSQFHLPARFPGGLSPGQKWKWFPNALDYGTDDELDSQRKLVTTRELIMMRIMATIFEKPDWDTKVFNNEIVAKWRKELLENETGNVTEAMVDWIEKELKFKAKVFQETRAISIYDGDIVKSDTAIPESVKKSLKKAVARLEDVPERKKDYHPGSDNQVINLVHPSLFPLVYGKTRVVTDRLLTVREGVTCSGEGKTVPKVQPYPGDQNFSYKFQWLPCEVQFKPAKPSTEGDSDAKEDDSKEDFRCEIASYINNLHPEDDSDLYQVIEEIIAHTVPLWNMTLTAVKVTDYDVRIKCSGPTYAPIPRGDYPLKEDGEGDADYRDRILNWEYSVREPVLPEPGAFRPPITPNYRFRQEEDEWKCGETIEPRNVVSLQKDYKESGLQVIVKLANIHLTPDKPSYPGGSWHVEGQLNERICATALYYYDSENITDSNLSFRHRSHEEQLLDQEYEQDDSDWLAAYYNLEQDGPMIQDIGSVLTKEDRLLTFPNIFQHNVSPFKLQDATKPGHRKIVAFFLVDPGVRVISTAHVPAQQRDWWERQVPLNRALSRLPWELRNEIVEHVDEFPISMDEAKETRLELMKERKSFAIAHDAEMREYTISLCEH